MSSFDVAAFNADWTRRKSVNTQKKLVGVLAEYSISKMCGPAAITLSEINKKTASDLADSMGGAYDFIAEKVGYDHLALMWDTDVLEKTGRHNVSVESKYIVAPFKQLATDEQILIASVHLPWKRPKNFVGKGTMLDVAHASLAAAVDAMWQRTNATRIIIKGDTNTQPDQLAEYHPDYTMLFDAGDVSTVNATCPDNVLVWSSDDSASFSQQRIFSRCEHFEHHPIYTYVD
jgi:hypothetical protein